MEMIDPNVNCDGMLTLLTFARGVINGIWMVGGVNPSLYVYKVLAYEDVEFFINCSLFVRIVIWTF